MDVNYYKWLDLQISHTYFKGGKSSIFQLSPLHETSLLLRNYTILIDKREDVFSFYLGLKNEEQLHLKEQLQGVEDLYFQITTREPQFFNYTDLEPKTNGQLFYVSNENTAEEPQRLQKSENVSRQDVMNFRPNRFTVGLPSGEMTVVIKNRLGTVVFQDDVSNPNEVNYPMDMSHQDDGAYQLWIDTKLQETFFISSQELLPNCLGIVHLNTASLLAQNSVDVRYHIDFKARSVYWKYQIIVSDSRTIDISSIQITDDEENTYEGPTSEILVGGQTALVFKSKETIPLQEHLKTHPQLSMSYTSDFSNRTNTLELKLPNPSSESISKEQNVDAFFSTTIVYV